MSVVRGEMQRCTHRDTSPVQSHRPGPRFLRTLPCTYEHHSYSFDLIPHGSERSDLSSEVLSKEKRAQCGAGGRLVGGGGGRKGKATRKEEIVDGGCFFRSPNVNATNRSFQILFNYSNIHVNFNPHILLREETTLTASV